MSESRSISNDVMEENENLRQQVREFKDENENLRKTVELLLKGYGFSKNKKKRELQLQNEKLCLENSELNYCVAYLHCENQALRQQVQAKESAYEINDQEWKSALEQLKNNLKMPCKHEECEMEKLALEEKVKDLQTDNHETNASLENLKDLKELYEELKQENESLNNQNQDLKQEIEAKNIAIQEEVKEIRSVLQGLKSFEEESNRIKEQNNALEQEVQELTKKLADCQKEMRQNEQALEETMHLQLEEYKMEKLALQEKVEDLQTDNQAFRLVNDAIIQSMCELKLNFQKEKDKMRK